jgi:hypothetical protein
LLRRCLLDSRGAAAMIFAITVPLMMGFAGLGIEAGSWLWHARAMQGAADAAATSAADALAFDTNPANPTSFRTEGTSVAAVNGWQNGVNGVAVTVNNPPVSGGYAGNPAAVEVIITQTSTNWFSGMLPIGYAAPQLKARSVALSNPAIDCILSLSNNNTPGVNFALLLGSVNMPNCSIGDNAQGSNALEMTGLLTSVTAYTATVYGGINAGFLNAFNFTRAPSKNSNFITPDPYACPGTQCRTMPTPTVPTALTAPATTVVPTTCAGAAVTTSGAIPAGCSKGIATSGAVTLTTAACTSASPCVIMSPFTTTKKNGKTTSTYNGPAISVTGGTLTINGGGYLTILGGTAEPAINVSGTGNVTINATTNTIQGGGSGGAAISVSGGTLTLNATTNNILGGPSGTATYGISLSGTGTVNINATTNNIQGGTGTSSANNAAINLAGTRTTLTFGPSNNNVIAGPGSSAITLNGSLNAHLVFGNGNNNIQGAASDRGRFSAMTVNLLGDVVFGNGNTTFGGPAVTANVPAVNDNSGFGAGSSKGLTLGSGTFQFMEGLSVTGGDLTLNPPATSGGIGYYIMNGGSNGGLNMTFGQLIGTNATIVLTGSGSDYANLNFNGADGMTLTAPTTGNTAGIAIFQDRNATTGNTNTVYGINFDNITGAIYTPNQMLQFEGLSVMNSQCMQLIGSTIRILGLAFINDQCEGTGVSPIGGNGAITLVE